MDFIFNAVCVSALVGVIALIRTFASERLPKRVLAVLWIIAALRLLLPVSLPSVCSVYGLVMARAVITPAGAAADTLSEKSVWFITAELLHAVRYMGAAAFAAYFIVSHLRGRLVRRTALPADNPYITAWVKAHPLRRSLRGGYAVRQSDLIQSPFTSGILRPVIYLPKALAAECGERLDYVLAHEHAHIKRFDTAVKCLFAAALCAQWYNPAVWLMYILSNRDIERACDEAVLRESAAKPSAYALTLLSMAEERGPAQAACGYFARHAVEERVRSVMKTRRHGAAAQVLAWAMVAGVTLLFATTPRYSRINISVAAMQTAVADEKSVSDTMTGIYVSETQSPTADDVLVSDTLTDAYLLTTQAYITDESNITDVLRGTYSIVTQTDEVIVTGDLPDTYMFVTQAYPEDETNVSVWSISDAHATQRADDAVFISVRLNTENAGNGDIITQEVLQ